MMPGGGVGPRSHRGLVGWKRAAEECDGVTWRQGWKGGRWLTRGGDLV